MAFGPSSEIIGLSKHYWFNLVVITILAGIVVICNYIFIPTLGIEGAAYSSCIALLSYNVLKFIFIYARFGLQPFTANTIKVIVISAVVVMLNIILPRHANTFIDVGYRSVLITLVFGGLIVATKSSEEVNKVCGMAIDLIRRKLGRK
jgi:O-antigen/teichoic acid export membrane protein